MEVKKHTQMMKNQPQRERGIIEPTLPTPLQQENILSIMVLETLHEFLKRRVVSFIKQEAVEEVGNKNSREEVIEEEY